MRSAFLTGGTGFLGRHLAEQLVEDGYQVTCLHRASSDVSELRKLGPAITLAKGELFDDEAMRAAIPEGVDAVFHVAGNTSMWKPQRAEQRRDNVDGTRTIVAAALAKNAKKLVYTSTWGTYGLDQGALTESSPQHGRDTWIHYEHTKWLAEEEVRVGVSRGLDAVIVNPPHILGRYDGGNWARIILMVNEGRLPGVPPGSGMFAWGPEVARAHRIAAQRGRRGENYLLPGAPATFLELVTVIGELTGRKVPKSTIPAWVLKAVAHLKVAVAGVTGKEPDMTPEGVATVIANPSIVSNRAKDELAYRTVPLRDMLKDSHDWLKSTGRLK